MERSNRRPRSQMSVEAEEQLGLTRRQFLERAGALAALGVIDPMRAAQALSPSNTRLSWLANRTAQAEGSWRLEKVEGEIPRELSGTLYRIGPGQKENHGVLLKHFFDGDAFIQGYSFREGKVSLRAQFIATPEREEELREGRMIYGEFGTPLPERAAPATPQQFNPLSFKIKNQGNVNVIPWDGRLLCLSEGGHPSAVSPADFAFQGYWDFHGTLPKNDPMTAHPKFDPKTGEGFMFGIRQGFPPALMVYRMQLDGTLSQLHEIRLQSYLMIHDMILTPQWMVFVAPPVKFNPMDVFSGKSTIGEALRFFESEPLRVILARRDGQGPPRIIEQPSAIVFHHGNGFEREGRIVIDSMLARDGESTLRSIRSWSETKLPEPAQGVFTRLVISPEEGRVESRSELDVDQELPRFDQRRLGTDLRYLYTGESGLQDDPFAFTHIVRHDLKRDRALRAGAGPGRAVGEPVFVPRAGADADAEDQGWIMVMGYDAPRDETYIEIQDAATLEFQARVWTGLHFPLGFHGNFVPERFVTIKGS